MATRMALAGTGLALLVSCSSEGAQQQTETGPSSAIVGDGTFKVGTDIEPGTYRSEGNLGGSCEWSRQSRLDGVDVFDNRPDGPQTVEILLGDDAFQTRHCQDWHRVE